MQHIVKIVRDAARELADRLHFLRLAQRSFYLLASRNVRVSVPARYSRQTLDCKGVALGISILSPGLPEVSRGWRQDAVSPWQDELAFLASVGESAVVTHAHIPALAGLS
jgi:hypothetical protein